MYKLYLFLWTEGGVSSQRVQLQYEKLQIQGAGAADGRNPFYLTLKKTAAPDTDLLFASEFAAAMFSSLDAAHAGA